MSCEECLSLGFLPKIKIEFSYLTHTSMVDAF